MRTIKYLKKHVPLSKLEYRINISMFEPWTWEVWISTKQCDNPSAAMPAFKKNESGAHHEVYRSIYAFESKHLAQKDAEIFCELNGLKVVDRRGYETPKELIARKQTCLL